MKFPDRLKELRKNNNLTQEELAKKIFVSRTLITKYESGDVVPTRENIEKLALVLNTTISGLLDSEDSTLLTLEYAKYSIQSNYIFNFIAIIINFVWIIISTIPIFGDWKYIYPIPDGATIPERKFYVFSLIQNSLQHNSYVVLFSIMFSIIFILLLICSFFIKNKKINIIFKWINVMLFMISLFLIMFGFVFGLANGGL